VLLEANKDSPGAPPAAKSHNIALGLERIGLVSLYYPIAVAIIALLLSLAAAVGITRLKVDDSLSQLFRSNTAEFKQYEEVSRRFPSSEYDVLIVVEGKTLLQRSSFMKLRDVVTDVQLIDSVKGIISLFSARQPPEGGQIPAPLFPAEVAGRRGL
jgi:Predicted exporters of the RND superfamily